jgi:hypothetical protein
METVVLMHQGFNVIAVVFYLIFLAMAMASPVLWRPDRKGALFMIGVGVVCLLIAVTATLLCSYGSQVLALDLLNK